MKKWFCGHFSVTIFHEWSYVVKSNYEDNAPIFNPASKALIGWLFATCDSISRVRTHTYM